MHFARREQEQSDSIEATGKPMQLELPFTRRPRLLIVEDDYDSLELLSLFLSSRGYSIITAQTGRQALEAIESYPDIDVVLLDLFIPGVGGMDVLAEINKRETHPGVIILTALPDRQIAQKAMKLGAFDCILKPADLAHVESSINACLDHIEYRQQSWWKRLA